MHNFNPWHQLDAGHSAPETVNVVIEIPQGSSVKYELHKDSGMLMLDRTMSSAVSYPTNYGFIPQSYCEDKDPLDMLVISEASIQPLCIVEVKVIGVMKMLDAGEMDDKIIGVPVGDKAYNWMEDISDIPKPFLDRIKVFFKDYKKLDHKVVEVDKFYDRTTAIQIVADALELYKKEWK